MDPSLWTTQLDALPPRTILNALSTHAQKSTNAQDGIEAYLRARAAVENEYAQSLSKVQRKYGDLDGGEMAVVWDRLSGELAQVSLSEFRNLQLRLTACRRSNPTPTTLRPSRGTLRTRSTACPTSLPRSRTGSKRRSRTTTAPKPGSPRPRRRAAPSSSPRSRKRRTSSASCRRSLCPSLWRRISERRWIGCRAPRNWL